MKTTKLNRLWAVCLFAAIGINMSLNQTQDYGSAAFASEDPKLTDGNIKSCIDNRGSGNNSFTCTVKVKAEKGKTEIEKEFTIDINFDHEAQRTVVQTESMFEEERTQRSGVDQKGKAAVTMNVEGCDSCADNLELYKGDEFNSIGELATYLTNRVKRLAQNIADSDEQERLDEIREAKEEREAEQKERLNAMLRKQCLVTVDGERIETEEEKMLCVEDMLYELEGRELASFVDRHVFPNLLYTVMSGAPAVSSPYYDMLVNSSEGNAYLRGTLHNIKAFDHNYSMKKYQQQSIVRQANTFFGNSPMRDQIIETEMQRLDEAFAQHTAQAVQNGHPAFRNQLQNIERAYSLNFSGMAQNSGPFQSFANIDMFAPEFMSDLGFNTGRVNSDSFLRGALPANNSFNPSNSRFNSFSRGTSTNSVLRTTSRRGRS